MVYNNIPGITRTYTINRENENVSYDTCWRKNIPKNHCKNIHKPNDNVTRFTQNFTTGRLTIEVRLVRYARVAVYVFPVAATCYNKVVPPQRPAT